MTLTGIAKHVHVLENAQLVTTEKVGRAAALPARTTTARRRDGMANAVPADGRSPRRRTGRLPRPHEGRRRMRTRARRGAAALPISTPTDREFRTELRRPRRAPDG